jgi:hypothetical protein
MKQTYVEWFSNTLTSAKVEADAVMRHKGLLIATLRGFFSAFLCATLIGFFVGLSNHEPITHLEGGLGLLSAIGCRVWMKSKITDWSNFSILQIEGNRLLEALPTDLVLRLKGSDVLGVT